MKGSVDIDYRAEILKRLESSLINEMDSEQVGAIANSLLVVLDDYEVQTRCTEVAVVEAPNEELIKRYAASLLIEGKSKKTIEQYVRVCLKLSDYLNKPLTETTAYDVKTFLAIQKARKIKNVTLENIRSYISTFFNWLENEELIIKSPCRTIKPIKCEYEIKLPFSKVELDALRSNCSSQKERAIIDVLISSGVRISELMNAKISDIDFKNLIFHVKNGKGGKDRVTCINEVAATHLQKYLNSRTDICESLFITRLGTRYSTNGFRFLLNQIAQRADVENVHPHRFRRTFATDLVNRGMDIQEVKRLMGHSDINTTLKYVYTSDEKIKESYRKYA